MTTALALPASRRFGQDGHICIALGSIRLLIDREAALVATSTPLCIVEKTTAVSFGRVTALAFLSPDDAADLCDALSEAVNADYAPVSHSGE